MVAVISLAAAVAIAAAAREGQPANGAAMVQVRAGLGLVPSFTQPEVTSPTPSPTSANLPKASSWKALSSDSSQMTAAAGAHAEAHRVLQERLNEALAEGQQAIAKDRQILKGLPTSGVTGGAGIQKTSRAPAINQMLQLAAHHPVSNVSVSQWYAGSNSNKSPTAPEVPVASFTAPSKVPRQVPRPVASLTSYQEDLPQLLATENHMHLQASATTRRVADALAGAVTAEQEAQALEANAAELRANASLVVQRGAAAAEEAAQDIAKKTAQVTLQNLTDLEQQAESAEVSAATYRARANSASRQANVAVNKMYHALNLSSAE